MSLFPRCPMATIESDPNIETNPRAARPRFGPSSAGNRMTVEEFDAIPASRFVRGYRYEVINGVLVVSPYPGPGERNPNDDLGYLLRLYQESHPRGSVIDETLPEQTVAATNRRRADRVIWVGLGRKPDELKDVPAIVAEFVSSKRRDALRDYESKRDEYLAAGVEEYWIIDRFRRVMIVYRKGPTGPTFDVVTEAQNYETALLPGFVLPLSRLLAKADCWEPRAAPKTRGAK
jgi:Uma2 family endonuclease